MLALAFSGDLIAIQVIHSELDAIALSVSHQISFHGMLTDSIRDFAEKDGKTHIVPISEAAMVGEAFEYKLWRYYEPLFVSEERMEISIRRSAVVGYY